MVKDVTYGTQFEIELDVLHYLTQTDKPKRHSQIHQWLITNSNHPKPAVLKVQLSRALHNLQKTGLITKNKKSHKHVTYAIINSERTRHFLTIRTDPQTQTLKASQKEIHSKLGLKERNIGFVYGATLLLIYYERVLVEASANSDRSMFLLAQKRAKNLLCVLFDELAEYLQNNTSVSNPEVEKYYTENLKIQVSQNLGEDDSSLDRQLSEFSATRLGNLDLAKRFFEDCVTRINRLLMESNKV
jgi:Fe2+ or Zn2+ uptake regulation protein